MYLHIKKIDDGGQMKRAILDIDYNDVNGDSVKFSENEVEVGYEKLTNLLEIEQMGKSTGRDAKAIRDVGLTAVTERMKASVTKLNTPPLTPSEGDAYLVGDLPLLAWASFSPGNVARYEDGAWVELIPKEYGYLVLTDDAERLKAAEWYIGKTTYWLQHFTKKDFKKPQRQFDKEMVRCRTERFKWCQQEILVEYKEHAVAVLTELQALSNMHEAYQSQGFNGLMYGDDSAALAEWVLGVTPFDGSTNHPVTGDLLPAGLALKGWTGKSDGLTIADTALLFDKVLFKFGLTHGDYDDESA